MASVYVPRGTKRKSKVELLNTAEAYLTNGHYDQKKSAMIAEKHKEKMLNKFALKGKRCTEAVKATTMVFNNFEKLIDNIPVWSAEHHKQIQRIPNSLVQTNIIRDGVRKAQGHMTPSLQRA